ncbi:MAG: hypothetical protein QXP17_02860 [Candidatus Jordarchaeales archaeon]
MSDDIGFMLDFGESKKVKQLAEIITGLINIILNAVGLLEDRINQLESELRNLSNEVKSLEMRMNTLETKATVQPPPVAQPVIEREREYAFNHDVRPLQTMPVRTPVATTSMERPVSAPKAPSPTAPLNPASARMQLQSELKELFSRLRRSE